MPVSQKKDKKLPRAVTKLFLKQDGKAELQNTSHPGGLTINFDYTIVDTDYDTWAIIVSKTNLMVREMLNNDL